MSAAAVMIDITVETNILLIAIVWVKVFDDVFLILDEALVVGLIISIAFNIYWWLVMFRLFKQVKVQESKREVSALL